MADARVRRARLGVIRIWKRLVFEQRVAAIGALLLIVSTLGTFSFVEAAEVLVALGVLALLRARGEGRRFRLPVRDGTVILAAGAWAGLLIAVRLFDRPLGQNLLALACAAILALAGLLERAKDAPEPPPVDEPEPPPAGAPTEPLDEMAWPAGTPRPRAETSPGTAAEAAPTVRLPADAERPAPDADTEPLPPPEFRPAAPGGPATSAGRRGRPADGEAHEDQADDGGGELESGGQEDRPG